MENIYEIAKKAGIEEKYVIPYGLDKAKIDFSITVKSFAVFADKLLTSIN